MDIRTLILLHMYHSFFHGFSAFRRATGAFGYTPANFLLEIFEKNKNKKKFKNIYAYKNEENKIKSNSFDTDPRRWKANELSIGREQTD